jgi:hypothetical protein
MHWCYEETAMLMSALPFLGYALVRVKMFFKKKSCCPDHAGD